MCLVCALILSTRENRMNQAKSTGIRRIHESQCFYLRKTNKKTLGFTDHVNPSAFVFVKSSKKHCNPQKT